MRNHSNPNIALIKPTCAGCRQPLAKPVFQIQGLYVCVQCFDGHVAYWQTQIESERIKHGHKVMRGGLCK